MERANTRARLLPPRQHGEHEIEAADWIDPFSSANYFDGCAGLIRTSETPG